MHDGLDQVAAPPSSNDSISVNASGTDRPVMRNRLALRHMVKFNAAPLRFQRAVLIGGLGVHVVEDKEACGAGAEEPVRESASDTVNQPLCSTIVSNS